MSQAGAGVRREREAFKAQQATRCPPHPENMIVHYDNARGQIPRRVCTRCFVQLPCQGCGRERIEEPGDPCPLEHCEARRPW